MIRGVIFDLGGTLIHFDGDSQAIAAKGTADLAAFLVKQGLAVREKAFARAALDALRAGLSLSQIATGWQA